MRELIFAEALSAPSIWDQSLWDDENEPGGGGQPPDRLLKTSHVVEAFSSLVRRAVAVAAAAAVKSGERHPDPLYINASTVQEELANGLRRRRRSAAGCDDGLAVDEAAAVSNVLNGKVSVQVWNLLAPGQPMVVYYVTDPEDASVRGKWKRGGQGQILPVDWSGGLSRPGALSYVDGSCELTVDEGAVLVISVNGALVAQYRVPKAGPAVQHVLVSHGHGADPTVAPAASTPPPVTDGEESRNTGDSSGDHQREPLAGGGYSGRSRSNSPLLGEDEEQQYPVGTMVSVLFLPDGALYPAVVEEVDEDGLKVRYTPTQDYPVATNEWIKRRDFATRLKVRGEEGGDEEEMEKLRKVFAGELTQLREIYALSENDHSDEVCLQMLKLAEGDCSTAIAFLS